MNAAQVFDAVIAHERETILWQGALSLLEWDERTGMPLAGGDFRADQVGLLAKTIHRRRTDPQLGEWLDQLADSNFTADPHSDTGATVRCLKRDYDRARRLPTELVEALSRATVFGQQHWEIARRENQYATFKPSLHEIFRLKREVANLLAEPSQPHYDALLDEYEEHASSVHLRATFSELRSHLVELSRDLAGSKHAPDASILQRPVAIANQRQLSRRAAELIGFDFHRGRLDETCHPFCTSLGPNDCRILTRYQERWFPAGLFGTLHEAGHGIYDQGLRAEWYGLAPGNFVSLGIHESQSRLWENLVGRSKSFWEFFWPEARGLLGPSLSDVSLEDFWRAINVSRPSLIRVEADEVTYNLHIIIRFDLEQQLLDNELSLDDLPDAWADRYASDLGIRPPSPQDGVLQDVHWSAGLIGYFPTYTLGNVIASQLLEAIHRDLGDQDAMWRRGDFKPLLGWLKEHIHTPGRCYSANELVERATGAPVSSVPLVKHLRAKYREVYRLD